MASRDWKDWANLLISGRLRLKKNATIEADKDVTINAGKGAAGTGQTGAIPGKTKIGRGLLHFGDAQVIDMADVAVALTVNPVQTPGTLLTSNVLRVDANSGATENLDLPPEDTMVGVLLLITNTGGESIVVRDDGGVTIDTVATAEFGMFYCDGVAWQGMNKA